MRISVNLATRPFVELRPFFARLRIIMAALLLVAIALGVVLHFEHAKLVTAEKQMDAVRRRTIAAQEEKLRDEARMRQPANAAVLDRAHFLNELFLRKSFSWTAVMMDLENVLPTGVQVTTIEPSITADNEVTIRLRVSGDRDRAVQLVRNLERSTRFLQPRLSSESSKTKENGIQQANAPIVPGSVEFDILAVYNPLPETAGETAAKAGVDAASGAAVKPHAKKKAAPFKPGPHDGIVLKPYAAPRPAAPVAARPAAPMGPPRPGGVR